MISADERSMRTHDPEVRLTVQPGHSRVMPSPIFKLPQSSEFFVTNFATIRRLSQEKRAQLKNLTASPFPGDMLKRLREGKAAEATCVSCNRCFAAAGFHGLPLRCYHDGLPLSEVKRPGWL